jgi:hypothetical protein
VSSDPVLNVDPAFAELCLNFKQDEILSPILSTSPISTVASETVTVPLGKLLDSKKGRDVTATADLVVSDGDRLTNKYPYAWSDFYPNRTPCVYKSGHVWDVRKGPEEYGIAREPRTVCRPDIAPVWVSILQKIIVCLDSMGVNFTCINPFGWANEGEKELLCPFLLSVGVTPRSLDYDAAVAAAAGVKAILSKSGLPEAEVAFVEMVNKRLGGGPRLLPLDPIRDSVPEYRKHFSSALGLPIAPLNTPYYEGTGALYFRLGRDTKDIALLTCAHVVRPPPAFPDNKGMKRTNNRQPKEYMVALGDGGYTRAVSEMMAEISKLTRDIGVWNRLLERDLPAAKRKEIAGKVYRATNRINELDAYHTEVTKFRSTPGLRSIGWVLHSSLIQVPVQPLGYTSDWGLIQIDPRMIDEETFLGNKVYVGKSFPRFCPVLPFCRKRFFSTVMASFR